MPIPRASFKGHKQRYDFFLNPYANKAFNKCPKCDQKTKLRKIPLVIHIDPRQLITLNKMCRCCLTCDLIIVNQIQLETMLAQALETTHPEIIGHDYFVFGTIDRKDWEVARKDIMPASELIDRVSLFKGLLKFEAIPAERYLAGNSPKVRTREKKRQHRS